MDEVPGNSESPFMPHDEGGPSPVVQPAPQQSMNYDELMASGGERAGSVPRPSAPPPPAAPTVPAGWYPDPENTSGFRYGSTPSLRYFDGVQWTEHRAPMQRPQHQRAASPQQPLIVNQQFAPPQTVYVNSGSSSMAGVHLLLTLLTCGLWLPIWILIEIVQAISKR